MKLDNSFVFIVKTHEIGHVNANNRLRAVPSVFDDVSIQNKLHKLTAD